MWRAFNGMPGYGTAGLFLVFFFFLVVVIQIFGNDVQVNGMGLRHFELGFTFWAAQNLALFHLIFIDVNLCGTLRAANHGSILRTVFKRLAPPEPRAPPSSVLYNVEYEVNSPGSKWPAIAAGNCISLANKWLLRANIRNVPWSVWEV